MTPRISVVVPVHNPRVSNLRAVLAALRNQTLAGGDWETLIVDNASDPPLDMKMLAEFAPPNVHIVREPELGLTAARRRGVAESAGSVVVFVDDDNLLAPDYLQQVLVHFGMHPRVGALGGKILPLFETPPPDWTREFDGLIACRDFGNSDLISSCASDAASGKKDYPVFSPVGAGMTLRREAVESWAGRRADGRLPDRRGAELSSGGDNDIIFTVIAAGWEIGYFPKLVLSHLIPAERMKAGYLARLNRGIQKSWMQVLTKHGANPWPPLAAWTVPLRKLKAWFAYRAWSSPAAYVRWRGACGHFEGRIPGTASQCRNSAP